MLVSMAVDYTPPLREVYNLALNRAALSELVEYYSCRITNAHRR